MAKVKMQAGAEFDLLNKGEVQDVLKSWANELTRGAKIKNRSFIGLTSAGGDLLMGDQEDGPAEGMVWGITRFSVAPGPVLGANGLQVYANDASTPSALRIGKLVTDLFPDARGCLLLSGDTLRIAGAGITASVQVTVTMSYREVPELMAWSL